MNPKTMAAARTIGLLLATLAAGCAGPNAPAPETSAQSAPILAPPPSPRVPADTIAPEPPAPQAEADPDAAALPLPLPLPLPPAAKLNHSMPAAPAASAPKSPKPSARPPAPSATPLLKSEAPVPAARPAEATLDVADLKTRLRETHAIGTFTKIVLKNQMDDLLQQFRAVYEGGNRARVASLRQPFDTLVLKVLSVVKDGDPSLARTISASREAIWGILSDPVKFKSVS